jgi:hypothetical protein
MRKILLVTVVAVKYLLMFVVAVEPPDQERVLLKQNMPHHNYSSMQYEMSMQTGNYHQDLFLSVHSLNVDGGLFRILTNIITVQYKNIYINCRPKV